MKKISLLVCLTIVALLCLFSCQKQQYSAELPSTIYQNMDSFLASRTPTKGNGSAEVNSAGQVTSIVIPVLKSKQYELYFIEAHSCGYTYFYYYVPVNYDKQYFNYDVGIVVGWNDVDDSFAIVMDQLDLTPVHGIAYDSERNTWNLDMGGKCLDVRFPESTPVTTEEELYSYFEFEEYTVSGNSGEVQ